MECPYCHTEQPENAKFCNYCRALIEKKKKKEEKKEEEDKWQ